MLNFVKGFKRLIPEKIQYIILIALSGYAIVVSVWGQTRFFGFINSLLPITLIVAAVLIIQSKKETLLAHALLLFLFYADYFGGFIRAILSYNFGTNTFIIKPTFMTILCAVGSIYLILLVLSYLFEGIPKFIYKKSIVLFPLLMMAVYAYFNSSFTTALLWSLPVVAALMVGSPLAAILLIMRIFITMPFIFLDKIFNGSFSFTSVSYWLFLFFAFYILTISVLTTLKVLKQPKE